MLSIRTQDRMALVPYKNEIEIELYTNDKYLINIETHKHKIIPLGIYTTKERALEVLDEIQEAILSANMYICDGIVVEKVPPQEVVYQMPNE